MSDDKRYFIVHLPDALSKAKVEALSAIDGFQFASVQGLTTSVHFVADDAADAFAVARELIDEYGVDASAVMVHEDITPMPWSSS